MVNIQMEQQILSLVVYLLNYFHKLLLFLMHFYCYLNIVIDIKRVQGNVWQVPSWTCESIFICLLKGAHTHSVEILSLDLVLPRFCTGFIAITLSMNGIEQNWVCCTYFEHEQNWVELSLLHLLWAWTELSRTEFIALILSMNGIE